MRITRSFRITETTNSLVNQLANEYGTFKSNIVDRAVKDFKEKYDNQIQEQKSNLSKIGSMFR